MSLEKETGEIASGSSTDYEKLPTTGFMSAEEIETKVQQLAEEYEVNHTKLMWKIDLCVVPPLALLYFLSFLDRVNISNAKVYGLAEDINLTGNQYNTALTLFFVPYVFFEVISNYSLKFIKPHIWLSVCILFFGAVTIGMGFVKNFGELAACRFLLGIFESGTFPAIFYILANFYAKPEAQRRFSTFFSCTCLAGGAGGSIAYRIKDLDGKYGIESWRWIFIVEGAVTAGLAFFLFFVIPDFPENCRFLSHNEREFLKKKLNLYNGDSGFEFQYTPKEVLKCFKDPCVWFGALAYFGLIIPSYGYAYFATSIIKVMGYTGAEANQRSVYPWITAFGWSIMIAFVSDKMKKRLPFVILNTCIGITGLAIVVGSETSHVRYAGCFLSAMGLYSAMPSLVCWTSLNYGGHLRKAVGSGWQIGFGNIGGIVSTYIFLAEDAPRYVKGLAISMAFCGFAMFFAGALFAYYYKGNQKKQDPLYADEYERLTPREKAIRGDKNPYIPYLY